MNYHNESASGEISDWQKFGNEAASSKFVFDNARSLKIVRRVIDGFPQEVVHQYLYKIKSVLPNMPALSVKDILEIWHGIDSYCEPVTLGRINANGTEYRLSPMTGRHIVNVLNVLTLLSRSNQFGIKVAEIGAGMGGEYIVLNKLYDRLFSEYKLEYDVYDLESSRGFIEMNCRQNKVKPPNFRNIYSPEFAECEYDIVVSNGAFSEMRGSLMMDYYNKVIINARAGYFLSNFETHSAIHVSGWSSKNFFDALLLDKKCPILIEDISGVVSRFDNIGNVLILFGWEKRAVLSISSAPYSYFKILLRKVLNFINHHADYHI